MIIKRSTLMLLLLAAAASVALFVVKYRVQDLDDQMRDLSREIVETQESIHVLKSEWAHLNQPARLRTLAGKYLEVGPLDAERIGDADKILDTLPARADEASKDTEITKVEGVQ
ncbi:MAG: hypothetical protein JJ855_04825 [Rhodospirillales bacterium]|nr:hypothetical protein [Rhodospirillales bacterium]